MTLGVRLVETQRFAQDRFRPRRVSLPETRHPEAAPSERVAREAIGPGGEERRGVLPDARLGDGRRR